MALESRLVRVNVYFDAEVDGFWANSPDLDGLVVTGSTRGELQEEARAAAATLLELEGIRAVPDLQFVDAQ